MYVWHRPVSVHFSEAIGSNWSQVDRQNRSIKWWHHWVYVTCPRIHYNIFYIIHFITFQRRREENCGIAPWIFTELMNKRTERRHIFIQLSHNMFPIDSNALIERLCIEYFVMRSDRFPPAKKSKCISSLNSIYSALETSFQATPRQVHVPSTLQFSSGEWSIYFIPLSYIFLTFEHLTIHYEYAKGVKRPSAANFIASARMERRKKTHRNNNCQSEFLFRFVNMPINNTH